MMEQKSLQLVVSGVLVSNHTILAIVEGMRKLGYFRNGQQGRKDGLELATALKVINEYASYCQLPKDLILTTKHKPISEIPRTDYEPVEIMRACDNWLTQIPETFITDADEEAIIYMVKYLRKQVIADGIKAGSLKDRSKLFGKHSYYYLDTNGKWKHSKNIDWNIGEINQVNPQEQVA